MLLEVNSNYLNELGMPYLCPLERSRNTNGSKYPRILI